MTVFSILFSLLFALFVVVSVVGHLLLIGALLRPFVGKLDLTPFLMWHGTRPLRAR